MEFTILKKGLKKEFRLLVEKYQLDKAFNLGIDIFPSSKYDNSTSYLFYEFHDENIDTTIFMTINIHDSFSEKDKKLLKEINSEQKEAIFYFRLFHEFGHLVQMNEFYKKGGIQYIKDEMKNYEKEVEMIHKKIENEELSEKEAMKEYENLIWEKFADDFAKKEMFLRKESLFKKGEK